jgi:DNA-binding transcriptional LysR family regulator
MSRCRVIVAKLCTAGRADAKRRATNVVVWRICKNIIECASAVLYVELVSTTDAVGCLSLRVLESTQLLLKHGLETLDIDEQVPGMNISMVCRDPELMTREAQALADEVSYAFKNPKLCTEQAGNTRTSSLLHSPIIVTRP